MFVSFLCVCNIVFNKMRETNSEFFDAYDIRVQLKAQIMEMNEILSRLYGVPNPTASLATKTASAAIAESRACSVESQPEVQFMYAPNSSYGVLVGSNGFFMGQQQQQTQQQQQQQQQQMYFQSLSRKHSNSTPPRKNASHQYQTKLFIGLI